MKFPIIKNINSTTLSGELMSELPRGIDPNHVMVGNEIINRNTGDVVMSYNSEYQHEFLDIIHSFGQGWGIYNENNNIVYAHRQWDEYSRLLDLQQVREKDPEYQLRFKVRNLIRERDKIDSRLRHDMFRQGVKAEVLLKAEERFKEIEKELEILTNGAQ
jgi:hypothetical protein